MEILTRAETVHLITHNTGIFLRSTAKLHSITHIPCSRASSQQSAKTIVQQGLHSRQLPKAPVSQRTPYPFTPPLRRPRHVQPLQIYSLPSVSLTQALSSFGKFLYSSSSNFSPSSELGVAARAGLLLLAFCKAASDKASSARCRKRVASGA